MGDNRIDIIRDNSARSSLWLATKNEWLGLLNVAGLELEALYGGFAGEPFANDSQEYVFITRARAPSRWGDTGPRRHPAACLSGS